MRSAKYPVSTAPLVVFLLFLFSGCVKKSTSEKFIMEVSGKVNRVWTGPDFWANRLQDWKIQNGRLECVVSDWNRNVNLLTYRLNDQRGNVSMEVETGLLKPDVAPSERNWIGFRIGAKGRFHDYRDDAIYGKGIDAGVTTAGNLFIGKIPVKLNGNARTLIPVLQKRMVLKTWTTASENKNDGYILHLQAWDPKEKEVLAEIEEGGFTDRDISGSVALVSSFSDPGNRKDSASVWFKKWQVSGSKVKNDPERAFGPVLFTQYTLSRKILKLTAQMPPLNLNKNNLLILETRKNKSDSWKEAASAEIDSFSFTGTFRVENWDDTRDIEYRVVYRFTGNDGKEGPHYYEGFIRKNPVNKAEIVVAGFTGNNDLGFPNDDIVQAVRKKEPDLLFFSGDQIYEGVGGYGVQRAPLNKAILDYLRKWYLFGWEYGGLLRNTPSVSIPDDHDVYHGNIWGAGGKATPPGLTGDAAQDAGGYKMPAVWVNMVQRTQTSHLPDPFDPTPVEQGITVYYTDLHWGGVSFAIIEDRKFKAAPKPLLPRARINNGWPQNRNWNAARQGDVPDAPLLGHRQLDFLETWAGDWSDDTWMKVVLSQTIFANVATLPAGEYHDRIVPKLRILPEGAYPPNDRPVTDMDSDGWPQSGRNRALREMRKAFALHIAGDQHLGSTIQYGIDNWHDAGYAFCVPAVSNIWPRRWFPAKGGMNRKPGAPKYTGDFRDGFGNKITVYAVSNPVYTGIKPSSLYDRATGFGIVRFEKETRNIIIECWPRYIEKVPGTKEQYPGWPVTINQLDNYGAGIYGYLPEVTCTGMENPVFKILKSNGELYYALRIRGTRFKPFVFEPGNYTVVVGDPDTRKTKRYESLPAARLQTATIRVEF
ncbi:MAG: twin-arginine translocation pathway signal protein [Chlorobi bacterium]|nr:twin-arginine translocation pathway signal protein [Chlorobiota bacterium]